MDGKWTAFIEGFFVTRGHPKRFTILPNNFIHIALFIHEADFCECALILKASWKKVEEGMSGLNVQLTREKENLHVKLKRQPHPFIVRSKAQPTSLTKLRNHTAPTKCLLHQITCTYIIYIQKN